MKIKESKYTISHLEIHLHAPELNKIVLFGGEEIRTPGIVDFDEAIRYINGEDK